MKFLLLVLCLAAGLAAKANPLVAGQERGGADVTKVEESTLRYMVESGALKTSLLHYLDTIQISQITDLKVRGLFARAIDEQNLRKEILTPNNYVLNSHCEDSANNKVPASAIIGDRMGRICFDPAKLAEEYKDLGSEEALIRLAAIAFHEHFHHLQDPKVSLTENEAEAYLISSYVLVTARVEQQPVLAWALNPSICSTGEDRITARTIAKFGKRTQYQGVVLCLEKKEYRFAEAGNPGLCGYFGHKESFNPQLSVGHGAEKLLARVDEDGNLTGLLEPFNPDTYFYIENITCE